MDHKALIIFHFWTVCLLLPDVASSQLTVTVSNVKSLLHPLRISCGNTNVTEFSINMTIACAHNFWNQSTSVVISSNDKNLNADKVIFQEGTKIYEQLYVKSFLKAVFYYTFPKGPKNVTWNLTVITSQNSGKVLGRIYFLTDCTNTRSLTSLATSFKNFSPGISDNFIIVAPDNPNENFCVCFKNTITTENWQVESIKLEKPGFSQIIYHEGPLVDRHFYLYQGSNASKWKVEVETGKNTSTVGIDIIFNGINCSTIITLDNVNVNFEPGKTDRFYVKVENCSRLKNIQIRCQRPCNWILKDITIRSEDGKQTYDYTHGETVVGTLTFYTSNTDKNIWYISVCTSTATDEGVYLQLFGDLATSEIKRLATPEDDFQEGSCSNFTVGFEDIGNLQLVQLEKPASLVVNKLLISNDEISYPFHLVGEKGSSFRMVAYRHDILRHMLDNKDEVIDLHDTFTLVSVEVQKNVTFEVQVGNKGNNNKTTWESCVMNEQKVCKKRVTGRYVKFNGTSSPGVIELDVRPKAGRKIWFLNINFGRYINTAYVRLEDNQLSSFISYYLTKTNEISIDFYTENRLFNDVTKLILVTEPPLTTCENITMEILRVKSDEVASSFNTTKQTNCEWDITFPTLITEDVTTEKNNVISTSKATVSEYVQTLTSSATETSTNNGHANTTKWCPCPCVKVLTEAEFENRLKSLTKELKVNRNETNSYLRSKISAPDDRTSSQIIGSTAVIIMVVPFGLIVLIDLFPLLCFIYRKIISFI